MTAGTRIRNICFCLICIVVLCTAILYKAADMMGSLPEGLDNGRRSYLEGAALQPLPGISLAAFASGDFQDEMEDYLSGCWPARDEALLANAALQRGAISIANIPFGFKAYPTFFGSTRNYSPEAGALFETPIQSTDDIAAALESAAAAANELHRTFPDIQMVIAMPDRSLISEANPSLSLSGNDIVDYSYMDRHFFGNLDEDIDIVLDPKMNSDEFLASYYRTDHHWRMSGAYDMYKLIASKADLEAVDPSGSISFDDLPFYGSNSRGGLDCSLSDVIVDYEFALPAYRVWKSGKQIERNHRVEYYAESSSLDLNSATYNAYAYFYGSDYDRIVYTVESNEGKGDCIIIGDSYTQPIEPLLASSFHSTFVLDPRHYEGSLKACIEENDIETIIVLAGNNTIAGAVGGMLSR